MHSAATAADHFSSDHKRRIRTHVARIADSFTVDKVQPV